ncbi:MAG: alpha-amylase/4-alpha-glucanotransferase domain-containing protein [Campylobacterota bacterium]|nr:alpha-amylase/4-alpha-glucanotransferase domain-containing protein [Campylobacterota bacterium]
MQDKTTLLFGIHMHQPVDNFQWVIEHAVDVCYGPFFDVVSRYPEFRFSVHCSGWLMEQIEQNHPRLYKQITLLAKNGSIEFVSAGYYEPILSVIPSDDRVAQIDQLNASIESAFNQTPRGLWLTERVWESSLIPDLNRAGIKYTVMDDYHFQCAGFDEEILDGYYLTEEGGKQLALFPISKKLRYAIPFLSVESALKAVKSFNRKKDSAAIIFDDAEKFGMWPGTYEWVYEKEWLKGFIEGILADPSIETMQYGEYLQQQRTRGIAYLPNVSYYEMGEWSLRADDALKLEAFKHEMGHERYEREGVKFLKGGIWKNFFVKYDESNRIHKRMLELSEVRESVDKPAFDVSLHKLQTNDALWHGVFGGLYLPNLRDNAYRYMIECENLRYGKKLVVAADSNDLDGFEKIKAVTAQLIFRFDAASGGQLVEFDSRADAFNWQNTLTRRKEAYHQQLFEVPDDETSVVEDGIDTIHNAAMEIDDEMRDTVIYDWYLKNSFIDHISDDEFGSDSFRHSNFHEYGDFANQPFELKYDRKSVTFWRDGGLFFPDKAAAHLKKSFYPKRDGLDFTIDFNADTEQSLSYVLEHNFHFANYEEVSVNGVALKEEGWHSVVDELEIHDGYLKKKITIALNHPFDIYYFLLKTLSQSEKGFDLTIQGVSFAMVIPFSQAVSLEGTLEVIDV